MPTYLITYPTGRSETTEDNGRKPVTYAVVIKTGGRWSTWSGYTDRAEAYKEAAYLTAYSRMDKVTVVSVEKVKG